MSLDCVTVAVGRGADGGFGTTGNPSPNDYAFALTGGGGVSRGFTAFDEWEEKTYTVEVSDGIMLDGLGLDGLDADDFEGICDGCECCCCDCNDD